MKSMNGQFETISRRKYSFRFPFSYDLLDSIIIFLSKTKLSCWWLYSYSSVVFKSSFFIFNSLLIRFSSPKSLSSIMNEISFHISIALDFFFLSFEFRFRNPPLMYGSRSMSMPRFWIYDSNSIIPISSISFKVLMFDQHREDLWQHFILRIKIYFEILKKKSQPKRFFFFF